MYQHVVCAVDGSSASQRAVEEAVELAEEHGARLTVLTVEREVDSGSLGTVGLEGAETALEAQAHRKGESAIYESIAGVDLDPIESKTEILAGAPYRAICDYAESTDADIVVLGSTGKGSIGEFVLGSTSGRVAGRCGVPVHVV
jgi:nucleotide-binding universal stress UspA family protein